MIINQQGYGSGSPYRIGAQLALPASTANNQLTNDFVGEFQPATDELSATIQHRGNNGTYYGAVLRGGTWAGDSSGNLVAWYINATANGTYSANTYTWWSQSASTENGNLQNANYNYRGITLTIKPNSASCGANAWSYSQAETKDPIPYKLGIAGDFFVIQISQYRNGVGMVANFVPAHNGQSAGYLETVNNIFIPVTGATLV